MNPMFRFVDWRFLLSLATVMVVSLIVANAYLVELDRQAKTRRIDTLVAHIQRQAKDSRTERGDAARERQRLLDGQAEIRRRHENLLDYLRSQGITVPASVFTTSSGDDDDGGDTNITVRPGTSPSSPSPSPSTSPSTSDSSPSEDGGVTDMVPEVPLPGPAGEATDTAKRIVEDLPDMLPMP